MLLVPLSIICMSKGTALPTCFACDPAKTQQFDQSSQGTLWLAKVQKHLQVGSEDSDQPAHLRRLI